MLIGLRFVDLFLAGNRSLEERSEHGVHSGLVAWCAEWASMAKCPCKERERNV